MSGQLTVTDLKIIENEPRVHDLRLADRLRFASAYDIRQLIKRNYKLLEMHGKLVFGAAPKTSSGGRPGTEYWLNEAQTVVLAFLSEAPDAVSLQKEVIAVWQAFRRGDLVPLAGADLQEISPDMRRVLGGMMKTQRLEMEKHFKELLAEWGQPIVARLEAMGGTSPDATPATGYIGRIKIAEMAGVATKQDGRTPALTASITREMNKFCLRNQPPYVIKSFRDIQTDEHHEIWPIEAAVEWLANGGRAYLVAMADRRKAKITDQGVLPFRRRR